MIQITPHIKILVAIDPVDFRKGIDGLFRASRQVMGSDPFSGYIFVFCNRMRTSIKLLMYDGQGFWLCQKRLSEGRFNWWRDKNSESILSLAAHELQMLIWNGNISNTAVSPFWKKIAV